MRRFLSLIFGIITILVVTSCKSFTSSNTDSHLNQISHKQKNVPMEHSSENEISSMLKTNESGSLDETEIFARIRLTFEGEAIIVNMYDNPTTRDFLTILPLTLTFSDFANAEKVSTLPRNLSTEDTQEGLDPSIGDFTLYVPWAGLAIFYDDMPYDTGLVPMGRIDSGIEKLANMNDDFIVTIEKMN